ncbi:tetratricopeptide repeat protein [Plebeiibacterium sediminum]|uniref:Tetratricopeptide repeat protein n=1 Tax=Plebeiibacterium sediminum TaxID=2992112 RepID=A0AAE3SDP0_9BACT|nr:tetratricopeptide repeat protein [Plebeiobacterium sediminum]MCW3785057.1 tetratricopeptide repeat protein [Plebeiobacterium sediminum]
MQYKYLVLLNLVVLFTTSIFSQETSKEYIQKGNDLYDEQKFAEAIESYKMVSENDSNYHWMLAEMAMTYLAMEKFDSASITVEKGLVEKSNMRCHLLRTKGTIYEYTDNTPKSIETYQQAIKEYPYEYLLHYNLGISYLKTEQFSNAQKCFQEALRCNPYHASSHMQLGKLAARQKQYTRAMLSLETFLALEPASNRSNPILIFIENLSNNYIDTTQGNFIDPIDNNSLFDEIDHYIRAKIVLTSRFPLSIDFNASLVKQTKMLMEVLPYKSDEEDFWVQMYFPFFKAINEGNHLNPFLYTLLRSTGQEVVSKYNEKHEKELDAFYEAGRRLVNIKRSRMANIIGEPKKYIFDYYDNGKVYSIGNKNKEGNNDGEWCYFYANAEKKEEGIYIDGKKSGIWKYYNDNGVLAKEELYKKGKLIKK